MGKQPSAPISREMRTEGEGKIGGCYRPVRSSPVQSLSQLESVQKLECDPRVFLVGARVCGLIDSSTIGRLLRSWS